MITFKNIIDIQQPVEAVFDFVADPVNIPLWNYYVRSVQPIDSATPQLGAAYHQVRESDEQTYAITEFDAYHVVTVKTTPGSSPSFERRMRFESVGGGTRISDHWTLDTGLLPVLEGLGRGKVRAAVAENLYLLKQLLETGTTRLQDGRVMTLAR